MGYILCDIVYFVVYYFIESPIGLTTYRLSQFNWLIGCQSICHMADSSHPMVHLLQSVHHTLVNRTGGDEWFPVVLSHGYFVTYYVVLSQSVRHTRGYPSE